MLVDFHVHSTASDGTRSPSELISSASGFAAIAITDHDNCDGAGEFLAASGNVRRIVGIELSIEAGDGFDKFHLLGLGIDPENAGLKAFLRRVLEGRNERNRRIHANFARLGIDIRPESHGEVLARPHYARWLIEHGFAATVPEAFAKFLLPDSPVESRCYEERWHPSQEEAFAAIHSAGGICIMAHPKYWKREWKSTGCDYALAERELARLKEMGLDGLEGLYQANTTEENLEFVRIGRRLGFLMSAGSDFHGTNKPDIRLGMEVDDSYIRPLLEHLI